MAELPHSCSLFELPRELRDKIYLYLLEYNGRAPNNPSFPGARHRIRDIMYPKYLEDGIAYSKLLLVSRQLADEIKQVASGPPGREVYAADLDIMVKGYMFYPSWTYLPHHLPRGRPFNLNVHMRIFSTESFHSNDGWPRQPGAGFRSLMHLLGQLVQNGPAFYYTTQPFEQHKPFIMNRLSVRVTFHDYYTPATHPETTHNIFRMLKILAHDGIAGGAIDNIHVSATYLQDGLERFCERQYEVSDELNPAKAREWGSAGFYYAALTV